TICLEFDLTALDNVCGPELSIASNTQHGFAMNRVRAVAAVCVTHALQNAQLLNTFLDIQFGYQDATFDSQWHYK
ncbi:MAG: hypothetical protein IJ189_05285, partial [Clostridia bacterium]|nr:hypothetical protein [Clostridia bacterium]